MLDHTGPGHFGSSFALGFSEPNFVEKFEGNNFRTNPEQAMASSATSATSFELIEDQALTAEEVEMASQEAQEVRTDEPEAPPSAPATDVMNDLSSALERLRVAFSTPTPGLGASGPAEDEDKEMSDAVTTERATPPTKRLKGFVAASQKTTAPVNKPVSLVPVDGRPGYFKLVDLADLFPVLPASAATLLRDVTVEEAVSLFHKFVGKNLTEDLVVRILEAYVPMKIQEVWASQFQRNKACIGTQRMHRLDAGHSDYKFMCKACGTGWPEAANQCWVCRARSLSPSRHPGGRRHVQPAHCGGQADLDPAAGWGKPGCRWPRWYPGAGRPQAEEITMADVVPLNRRVDIRQEILRTMRRRRSGSARRSRSRCSGPCRRQRLRASSSTTPRWTGRFGRRKSQPFCSGSSTRFSLKWTGTLSSSTTSCGCFEARGQ